MGLADSFGSEDRVNVKFSDFYSLCKESAKCELLMNATQCRVSQFDIIAMATGEFPEIEAEEEILTKPEPLDCECCNCENGNTQQPNRCERTEDEWWEMISRISGIVNITPDEMELLFLGQNISEILKRREGVQNVK